MRTWRGAVVLAAIVGGGWVWAGPDGTSQPTPPVRLELDLLDGSHVIGVSGMEVLSLQTAYAKLSIPVRRIRTITPADDRETATVEIRDGDRIKGVVGLETIELATVFGRIRIGFEHVTKVRVVAANEPGQLTVPEGFKAAPGAKVEPYTNTGWAQEIVHEKTGMTLVYIPAGQFVMGSPADEPNRHADEIQHRVTLTKGFYLGKYELTQGQWEVTTGKSPSNFKGRDRPVEQVSWDDCQEFIQKLNAALLPPTTDNRQPTTGFRLPTEAEWEYACRAGTKGGYAGNVEDYGWYNDNSGNTRIPDTGWTWTLLEEIHCQTHPVGQKKANAWGLFDMLGNVWEWCADWHGDYPPDAVTDPTGPAAGHDRVIRGWSWSSGELRVAGRGLREPGLRAFNLGCRLAFSPAPGQ